MQQEAIALDEHIRQQDHMLSRAEYELDDLKRVHMSTLQSKQDLERDLHQLHSTTKDLKQQVQDLQSEKEFIMGMKGLEISDAIRQAKRDAVKLHSDERAHYVFEKETLQEKVDHLKGVERVLSQENASLIKQLKELQVVIPTAEACQQTEVSEEDGLWDKQDGWTMPLSKTRAIRSLWRKSLQFASCPSCRGVNAYAHMVGSSSSSSSSSSSMLQRIKRSSDAVIGDKVSPHDRSVWSLPDYLIEFMSNVPKTAQAFKAYSLAKTVSNVFILLLLRHRFEQDEDAITLEAKHTRPPLLVFVVERCLQSTKHRGEAELILYRLLKSVREFYPHSALLQMFARSVLHLKCWVVLYNALPV
jgi:cell division septum initiation protein DivIVA